MIDKKILDKLTLEELRELKNWIYESTSEEIDKDIQLAFRRNQYRTKKSPLNKKFDLVCMAEWKVFTIAEIEVLYANGINNLEELLNFDLDELDGASASMKNKFESRRQFYNLAGYSDCIRNVKKKR